MGAERMGMTWLPALRPSETAYQPRHRSTRQGGDGTARFDRDTWHSGSPGQPGRPTSARPWADPNEITDVALEPDFLDLLTIGEIRRMLEGCALEDVSQIVPELVGLIAHSSHTPATLTSAWHEFAGATRDAFASHSRLRDGSDCFGRARFGTDHGADAAVAMMTFADEAWQLITRGALDVDALAPARATAARSR
jgi:hypothetical protein